MELQVIPDEAVEAAAARASYKEDDVFPNTWDGPVNASYLHECSVCGAAVSAMGTHTDWHNRMEARK